MTWYLNRILRGDIGVALKWYFPVQRQYWCPKKAVANENEPTVPEDDTILVESIGETLKNRQYLENSSCVRTHSLRKQFGKNTAVDGLNLDMYSGQITGKSTVLSTDLILTRLYSNLLEG